MRRLYDLVMLYLWTVMEKRDFVEYVEKIWKPKSVTKKGRYMMDFKSFVAPVTSPGISGGAPKKPETSSLNPTTSTIARPPMMGQATRPHRIGKNPSIRTMGEKLKKPAPALLEQIERVYYFRVQWGDYSVFFDKRFLPKKLKMKSFQIWTVNFFSKVMVKRNSFEK